MFKTKTGIYQSELFNNLSVIHGVSTKTFGDMRNKKKRNAFLSALGISEESLVWQEQVHRDAIHIVADADRGKTIRGVDGMVYCHSGTRDGIQRINIDSCFPARNAFSIADAGGRRNDNLATGLPRQFNEKSIILSVHTADCVPLLAVDPVANVIAVAHAGWKGTVSHIGFKLIKKMELLGSKVQNIRVVIGPRIGGCCYEIDKKRADVFRNEFPGSDVIEEKDGKLFADIGKANYLDLIASGIQLNHVDFHPSLCTYCMKDDFYSFRRSGKPLEGEIIGVIGF